MKNGELLSLAAPDFDALITVDKNLQYQQNLSTLPLAVVILNARSNELQFLVSLVPELKEALASLEPRRLVQVGV